MSSDFVKVKLGTCTRIRRCETDKSYNLRWLGYIAFVPKSLCKLEDLDNTQENDDKMYRWSLTIPTWLLSKNDDLKTIVEHLKREEDEEN